MRTAGGVLATAATAKFAPVFAAVAPGPRNLSLSNLHTGEKLKLNYWADGSYEPAALAEVNRVLRDYRTGDIHPIEPKLLDLLHTLNQNMESEGAAFEVISGYRSPKTNGLLHEKSSGVAAKSLHMQGMAIDIRVPGRALPVLHDNALAMARGGVGFYPSSDFVHVDVGRVRKWSGA